MNTRRIKALRPCRCGETLRKRNVVVGVAVVRRIEFGVCPPSATKGIVNIAPIVPCSPPTWLSGTLVMPLGLDHGIPRLGSLDFLDGSEVRTQFLG